MAVTEFLENVEHPRRREDALTLLPLFTEWTGMAPVLWGSGLAGSGIVGYGHYHYKYASGREGDFFLTGFAPRRQNMAVYIMPGFKRYEALLARLGPHKHSVSCLYMTNIGRIDLDVLGEMVRDGVRAMKETHEWRAS